MKKRRLGALFLAAASLLALCALAGCCDRGEESSLAHCIENRTEGDDLTAAIARVTEAVQGLERLTTE